MLFQALDYFDYVTSHVETFARLYEKHLIDPTQQPRLLLIAPTFSEALVHRCKWLIPKISLFTYTCLKFEDEMEPVPVFSAHEVTKRPQIIEIPTIDKLLDYITDTGVRTQFSVLHEEIKTWKTGNIISTDAIKDAISAKVNGRVFAYLSPRRRFFVVDTYDGEGNWKSFPVNSSDDLANVKGVMKAAMETMMK
jgi:hypothetical protein